MWFERNEHDRLEELRNGDEPNGEIVQFFTEDEVLEKVKALESQTVHMDPPSSVKTPVSAFVAFRCAFAREDRD